MDEQQREKARQSWEKFLDPHSLRSNLIACSLFIVAWETFCNSAIDYLEGFYNIGHDPDLGGVSQEYQARVLDRHRSPLSASLLWFQEMGAIDEDDLDTVDRIRKHRNEIAHQLPKYLATVDYSLDTDLFTQLIELTARIGRWWVLEIEVPANPDFDNQEVNAEDVQSGDMWFLELLFQVATGDVDEAITVYQQFTRTRKTNVPDV